jgi:hypothetical protein
MMRAGDALKGHARRGAVQHLQGCGQAASQQQEDAASTLIRQEHKGRQQEGDRTLWQAAMLHLHHIA